MQTNSKQVNECLIVLSLALTFDGCVSNDSVPYSAKALAEPCPKTAGTASGHPKPQSFCNREGAAPSTPTGSASASAFWDPVVSHPTECPVHRMPLYAVVIPTHDSCIGPSRQYCDARDETFPYAPDVFCSLEHMSQPTNRVICLECWYNQQKWFESQGTNTLFF